MYDQAFLDRFNAKINKQDISGCWLWTAAILPSGYGMMGGGKGKNNVYAHRVALELKLGRPLTPGMVTCHSCRNRHCVAPHHLREGTYKDNAIDMVRDGTRLVGPGVASTKLNEDQVRAIRASTRKLKEIAAEYGICLNMVWKIRKRHYWNWLE